MCISYYYLNDYIGCKKLHGLKHSGIVCYALKHFEHFCFNMVQPSKLAFSMMSISIKTTIEGMEKSAQERVH